jgi:hypothetical protein
MSAPGPDGYGDPMADEWRAARDRPLYPEPHPTNCTCLRRDCINTPTGDER